MFIATRARFSAVMAAVLGAFDFTRPQHRTPHHKAHTPTPNNGRVEPRTARNAPRKRRYSARSYKPNGAQECQRRRVQMRRSMLTASNGLLVRIGEQTFGVDSHGQPNIWLAWA